MIRLRNLGQRRIGSQPTHVGLWANRTVGVLPQYPQHVVARAHRVVVYLAGRALLITVLVVMAIKDAVPGSVAVVHKMLPGITPQTLVPVPVGWGAGAHREASGSRQRLRLHPEVLVAVADGPIRREAVVDAAVFGIPGATESCVEQAQSGR